MNGSFLRGNKFVAFEELGSLGGNIERLCSYCVYRDVYRGASLDCSNVNAKEAFGVDPDSLMPVSWGSESNTPVGYYCPFFKPR